MTAEILRELVTTELLVGHDAANDPRLLQVGEVAIQRALLQVRARGQDLRDRQRPVRTRRTARPARVAGRCSAGRRHGAGQRRRREEPIGISVRLLLQGTRRGALPRGDDAEDPRTHEDDRAARREIPPARDREPPTAEAAPMPTDHHIVPRKDRATSWPLATGSTMSAATRRIPTMRIAATIAHAVRTASAAFTGWWAAPPPATSPRR